MTTTDPTPAAPVDPPGRPRVPRPRWSIVTLLYAAFAVGLIGWYAADAWQGQELFASTGDHDVVPPSVRASPGGYRSFHFWHSGYLGGK
jgi:hypothetical protein